MLDADQSRFVTLDVLLRTWCGQLPNGPDTWRRLGNPRDMRTVGGPKFGVCAAVDVHYLSTGGARVAAVLAPGAAFARAGRTHCAGMRVPPYQPGRFYRRELPPLRAVLDDLSGLGLLMVEGYADLDLSRRPPGHLG